LAQFSSESVRNWNRGESTIASMEMLTRGLGRLGTDLTLALPMRPPGTDTPNVLFRGDPDRIQFVAATGFGAGDHGLELISVSVIKDEDGIALVRERAPVTSVPTPFRDPVVLLRGRLQVQFAYRDDAGQTAVSWMDRPQLPRSVGVYVYSANGLPVFPVPVQLNLPTNLGVGCFTGDDDSGGCPQDRQQQQRRQQQQQQQQQQQGAANAANN
jgi:general secretion pathway protein J